MNVQRKKAVLIMSVLIISLIVLVSSILIFTNANKVVKNGDSVIISFKGYVNNKQYEGGSANSQQLVIGSNTFIPGFESQLIGHKVNDVVKIKVTFPSDYNVKSLAGKPAIFVTTIENIIKATDNTNP